MRFPCDFVGGQVEADALRLQIAAHPNPELRAKLQEAGVQVGILMTYNSVQPLSAWFCSHITTVLLGLVRAFPAKRRLGFFRDYCQF